MSFPRMSTIRDPDQFRQRARELGLTLPLDDRLDQGESAVLAQPLQSRCGTIGNRFCILPMEGWDGTDDGRPTDLTRRRWQNFGLSGAKLIWGGEAVAVRQDGRANPRQLLISEQNLSDLESLRLLLEDTHRAHFGTTRDLQIGLQLTHSGRYAKPSSQIGRAHV